MAPQRHDIPLDILPGFLPQRQLVKSSSLFGIDDVDYLQIKLESNASRIETEPKKLVKKIRFDDSKIDFNPDPFRRRSMLVRRNEWARLTKNYLMPELPRRLDERQLDSRIERPILPNLGSVIDKSEHVSARFKNAIPPTLKYKVASINAGISVDARNLRNNIVINMSEPKINPVSSITSNSRLDSPFEIDVSAKHSISYPIMQDVVLRSRKPRKPTELLYWKDVSAEETLSISKLKSLCNETYNTWFVQINRTGLRPKFQYPSIRPLKYADWKLIHIPTVSLPSPLGILSHRRDVHDIFEIFHDITKPESDSNSLNSLSFEPIRSTIDQEAIIRPRIQEFESQAPSQVYDSAHNFDNLSLLIERYQITRDGEAHAQEDYFFDGFSSEEDRAPPHTFKTIQRSQVRVSNSSDEGINDAPNVKPETPREKSIGQQSSEIIDLTVRNEREKPQGLIESSSLTDEQLIAHMEMLEREHASANVEIESSLTDEQLIAHMEMLERNKVFENI